MFRLCWICMTILEEHTCERIKEGLLSSWRLNHCMEIYMYGVTKAGFPWDTPGILGWAVFNWLIPHLSLWPVAGTVVDKYGRDPVAKSLASTGGITSKQTNYITVMMMNTIVLIYTQGDGNRDSEIQWLETVPRALCLDWVSHMGKFEKRKESFETNG